MAIKLIKLEDGIGALGRNKNRTYAKTLIVV